MEGTPGKGRGIAKGAKGKEGGKKGKGKGRDAPAEKAAGEGKMRGKAGGRGRGGPAEMEVDEEAASLGEGEVATEEGESEADRLKQAAEQRLKDEEGELRQRMDIFRFFVDWEREDEMRELEEMRRAGEAEQRKVDSPKGKERVRPRER